MAHGYLPAWTLPEVGGLPESLASVCGCECGETGGGEWPSSRPEKALGQADGTHLRRTFCLGMTGVQVANWTHSFSSGQGVLTSFPSSLLNSNLLESPFPLACHGMVFKWSSAFSAFRQRPLMSPASALLLTLQQRRACLHCAPCPPLSGHSSSLCSVSVT